MKDFKLLVGLFFANTFKKMSSKEANSGQRVLQISLLVLGFVALLAVEGLLFSVAPVTARIGRLPELVSLVVLSVVVITLIFSVPAMISILYLSRDTEFLLGLPFRTGVVYLAKLAFLYLTELIIIAIFMVPAMIIIGVTTGMGVVYYLIIPLVVIVIPLLPLFVASVVSLPLMYAVSFFRARGAMTSILMILAFAGIMSVYYFAVYGSVYGGGSGQDSGLSADEAMQGFYASAAFITYLLPMIAALMYVAVGSGNTSFGAISGASGTLINLGLFVASVAAILAIIYVIASLVYKQGIRSQLEGNRRLKQSSKDTQSTVINALISKEWKELVRTPAFALQCLAGVVLMPILSLFLGLTFSNLGSLGNTGLDVEAGSTVTVALVEVFGQLFTLLLMLFMGVSFNVIAGSIFSREGDKFYYFKMLPVDAETQIRAKLTLCYTISVVGLVASTIVFAIARGDILSSVLALPALLIVSRGSNYFFASFDVAHPKLTWTNPNEAVKNNKNIILPMFAVMAMVIGLIILVAMLIIVMAIVSVDTLVITIVAFVVIYGLAILYWLLSSKGFRYKASVSIDRIEV